MTSQKSMKNHRIPLGIHDKSQKSMKNLRNPSGIHRKSQKSMKNHRTPSGIQWNTSRIPLKTKKTKIAAGGPLGANYTGSWISVQQEDFCLQSGSPKIQIPLGFKVQGLGFMGVRGSPPIPPLKLSGRNIRKFVQKLLPFRTFQPFLSQNTTFRTKYSKICPKSTAVWNFQPVLSQNI